MKWGSEGQKAGQFNVPYSIEIDPLDNIYVVDRGNDRIQKFDENGTFVKQWDRPGKVNGSDQEFASPEDMVIDQKTGVVYITDTGNERVLKLAK
jgi:DNA-binding beta-propeller fold protein YncE